MTSKTTNKFSPEVRARAVRMVLDHEAEHPSLAGDRVDCGQDRLHGADAERVGEEGRGRCRRTGGVTTDMSAKLKALEQAMSCGGQTRSQQASADAMAEFDRHQPYVSASWRSHGLQPHHPDLQALQTTRLSWPRSATSSGSMSITLMRWSSPSVKSEFRRSTARSPVSHEARPRWHYDA